MARDEQMIAKIEEIMADKTLLPIKLKTLTKMLKMKPNEEKKVAEVLDYLELSGTIVKLSEYRYSTPSKEGMVVGKFQANLKGFGFVVIDDAEKDLFIPARHTGGAFDKDTVLCKIVRRESKTKSAEGEVVKVLERANDKIVGVFEKNTGFGFVIPDNKKLAKDIFVPEKLSKGAVSGEKVVVRINSFEDGRSPEGEILEVIGHKDDPGVDIISIVKDYDIPYEFSPKVIKELDIVPDEVLDNEKEDRLDLRHLMTVTIDGEDAKDLDDAITLEKLDNGIYRLGVHIADVSHYVRPGTNLDKEALKRGTSIYLVDRVIPMLPHKLSNGICSLNANTDRLSLSCIMDVNSSGKVVDYKIAETLINVDKRMSYTGVKKVLDGDEETLAEYDTFCDMIYNMKELAKILENKRDRRGSLEFVSDECKIKLDEKGKPIEIVKYERNTATKIIEEFMLLCNETIAEEYFHAELPFIYRVHETPDEEKLDFFASFIKRFSYSMKIGPNFHAKELQNLLKKIEGTKEEKMISKMMLRSMKHAKYSSNNDGHFGLAAEYYCHFTSPIRRYPDLMIHRIIKQNIKEGIIGKRLASLKKRTAEVAEKTSVSEKKAEELEREVDEYKKCEYMKPFVGERFEGNISGITNWGFYVELDNTVEGLVRVTSLSDVYIFDERNYILLGSNSNKKFELGDRVKVELTNVNMESREVDFIYIEEV